MIHLEGVIATVLVGLLFLGIMFGLCIAAILGPWLGKR